MNVLSRIILSTSDILLDALKDKKNDIGFKDNQILEAKVLKALSPGKAQLLIEGKKLTATTQMPLSENQTLYLKVTRVDGQQVLRRVEAYNPVVQPEGLSDMRQLGREGPFSNLRGLLNALPGSGAAIQDLPAADPAAAEKNPISAFARDKQIPLELKLALVLSGKPSTVLSGDKTLADFSEKLLARLPLENKGSAPVAAGEPASARLKNLVDSLLDNLGPSAKALGDRVMESKLFSWEQKMAGLLSPKGSSGLDKEVAALKNALMKLPGFEEAFAKKPMGTPFTEPRTLPVDQPAGTKPALVLSGENQALAPGKTDLPLKNIPGFPTDGPKIATDLPVEPPLTDPAFKSMATLLEKQAAGAGSQESPQMEAVIKRIKDLVVSFSLKSDQTFDEKAFKNLVRDSGLMWENKIKDFAADFMGRKTVFTEELAKNLMENDVKALAMKGTDLDGDMKSHVGETLKTFTESLEKMQLLNSHASEDSGRYLLPLPYLSGEQLRFGQILIDLDKKKGGSDGGKDKVIRVAFILDMSNLGHLQADVSVYKKSLSGEFLVGSDEAKELMDEALPALRTDLAIKGYAVRRMECRVVDPSVLSTTSLAEKLVDPEDGSVNILI